jgi:hypothetical protein
MTDKSPCTTHGQMLKGNFMLMVKFRRNLVYLYKQKGVEVFPQIQNKLGKISKSHEIVIGRCYFFTCLLILKKSTYAPLKRVFYIIACAFYIIAYALYIITHVIYIIARELRKFIEAKTIFILSQNTY